MEYLIKLSSQSMPAPDMQQWDPKQYAEDAWCVSELGMPVLELLSPQPGKHILDLGCGDGMLTVKLAKRGCEVVGIDSSPAMITATRAFEIAAQVMDGLARLLRS